MRPPVPAGQPGESEASGDTASETVFVSHSSQDAAVARDIRGLLESGGYRTWMAPESLTGGTSWMDQLLAAVTDCAAMVVVISERTSASDHVVREVSLALDARKTVIPVRVAPVELSGSLRYLLHLVQWVDAFPPPLDHYANSLLQRLANIDLEPPTHARLPIVGVGITVPADFYWLVQPPPSPVDAFVGRDGELSELATLLDSPDVRWITVVGAGGVGKTRLTLQVVQRPRANRDFEVCWVPLAEVRSVQHVLAAIASALRLSGGAGLEDLVIARLRSQRVLMVVDNLEHLHEAVPLFARLLAAAPELRVLATSRSRLHLAGEHLLWLRPLPLDRHTADGSGSAAELFLARAQAVRPTLTTHGHDQRTAIADICEHLDGLPLAIELAAARTSMLTPTALLVHLRQGGELGPYTVDAPARQRNLRATIDWSVRLLSARARTLLAALSVFAGGASLDAVEAVAAELGFAPEDTFADLSELVDASLVRAQHEEDSPRFGLFETVRSYAAEALREAGNADTVYAAHARYYLSELSAGWDGAPAYPRTRSDLERLIREEGNIRAAVTWSLGASQELLGNLLAGAAGLWQIRDMGQEWLDWLEGATVTPDHRCVLAIWRSTIGIFLQGGHVVREWTGELVDIGEGAHPQLLRAAATSCHAMIEACFGDRGRASEIAEAALAQEGLAVDDGDWRCMHLTATGAALSLIADSRAQGVLEAALDAARRAGSEPLTMLAANNLADYFLDKDASAACRWAEAAVGVDAAPLAVPWHHVSIAMLAMTQLLTGQPREVYEGSLREALLLIDRTTNRVLAAEITLALAAAAAARLDWKEAAYLSACADSVMFHFGVAPTLSMRAMSERLGDMSARLSAEQLVDARSRADRIDIFALAEAVLGAT